MIQAESLYKQYAAKKVLKDLSFTVDRGKVLGFIGPNGAGKTTAMRIICGIMPPTSGRVAVSGVDILSEPQKGRAMLGYLPENAPLHSGMSVEAFLKYCGRMRGFSGKALSEKVAKAVDRCRLGEVYYEDVDALSKGFRRRTCLAQAILHEPENLVLDEPTDGLDPDQKRDIRSLILELKETTAIIVSTHILEEIDAVCDRVLAIRRGTKVFDGTTDEFRALSPDAGAVEIVFEKTLDISSLRNGIPGAGETVFSEDDGFSVLTLRAGTLEGGALAAAAVAAAAERGLKAVSCRTIPPRLGDIFSTLGTGGEADR